MEEARGMAIESLREEFASMVERITERFNKMGTASQVFKDATVESFMRFFETFKERNIFGRTLAQLVEKAQAVLGGTSGRDYPDKRRSQREHPTRNDRDRIDHGLGSGKGQKKDRDGLDQSH